MPDLIIKDAKVLLDSGLKHVNIAIEDGKIVKVAKVGGGVSSGAEQR
jgi:dihydroorotase-like cyclic amidohydrolase